MSNECLEGVKLTPQRCKNDTFQESFSFDTFRWPPEDPFLTPHLGCQFDANFGVKFTPIWGVISTFTPSGVNGAAHLHPQVLNEVYCLETTNQLQIYNQFKLGFSNTDYLFNTTRQQIHMEKLH